MEIQGKGKPLEAMGFLRGGKGKRTSPVPFMYGSKPTSALFGRAAEKKVSSNLGITTGEMETVGL